MVEKGGRASAPSWRSARARKAALLGNPKQSEAPQGTCSISAIFAREGRPRGTHGGSMHSRPRRLHRPHGSERSQSTRDSRQPAAREGHERNA